MQNTTVVKPDVRRAMQNLRVACFKPSDLPTEQPGGDPMYTVQVVTAQGKASHMPCTKEVYQRVLAQHPNRDVMSDFTLVIDRETKQVINYTAHRKPSLMPGFSQENDEGGVKGAKVLILSLYPDGSVTPTFIPDRTPPQLVDAIADAVCAKDGEIHVGDVMAGYPLQQTQEVAGSKKLYFSMVKRQ